MKMKIFVTLFLVSLMGGCTVIGVGVVAAVGGTHYISGEIKSSYETSIYHLYEASLYTLKTQNIKTTSVENTKTDADIIGEFSDGKEVKIHIYYNKEGFATIGIRVGVIGDEHRSRKLLREIERYI